jgi:uncharacterized Zn-finger protein
MPILTQIKCSECEESFSTAHLLVVHMGNSHADKEKKRQFSCTDCQLAFPSWKVLKFHMRSDHLKPFGCLRCPVSFTTEQLLMEHATVGPYTWRECMKMFFFYL